MSQAQAAANAFNHFFNTPEMRAQRAERERERQARRAAILARYGSAEAVYANTEREAALREACAPFTIKDERPGYEEDYTLDGWGLLDPRDKVPSAVFDAVSCGWPLPTTVSEAWAEYAASEARENERHTMADASTVSSATIRRMEESEGVPASLADNLGKLQRTFEKPGLQLIPQNGGGPGVRLRDPQDTKRDEGLKSHEGESACPGCRACRRRSPRRGLPAARQWRGASTRGG